MKLKLQPLTGNLSVSDQVTEKKSVEAQLVDVFYPENRTLANRIVWRKWLFKSLWLLLFITLYLGMLYGYWQLRSAELEQNFIALKASIK